VRLALERVCDFSGIRILAALHDFMYDVEPAVAEAGEHVGG
jgi:hypothetical protein